jgi:hypothetical protein
MDSLDLSFGGSNVAGRSVHPAKSDAVNSFAASNGMNAAVDRQIRLIEADTHEADAIERIAFAFATVEHARRRGNRLSCLRVLVRQINRPHRLGDPIANCE